MYDILCNQTKGDCIINVPIVIRTFNFHRSEYNLPTLARAVIIVANYIS